MNKKEQYVCGQLNGSMTIEAAVIVPVTMIILVSILYLAYFVHDQAVITAVTDYAVMENAGKENSGNASQIMNTLMPEKMYSVSGVQAQANGNADSISANASASFYEPLSMIRQILGENVSRLETRIHASFFASRKKLLLYKSLCDGVSAMSEGGKP